MICVSFVLLGSVIEPKEEFGQEIHTSWRYQT